MPVVQESHNGGCDTQARSVRKWREGVWKGKKETKTLLGKRRKQSDLNFTLGRKKQNPEKEGMTKEGIERRYA